MWTRYFLGVKRPGRGVDLDHTPLLVPRLKNKAILVLLLPPLGLCVLL